MCLMAQHDKYQMRHRLWRALESEPRKCILNVRSGNQSPFNALLAAPTQTNRAPQWGIEKVVLQYRTKEDEASQDTYIIRVC